MSVANRRTPPALAVSNADEPQQQVALATQRSESLQVACATTLQKIERHRPQLAAGVVFRRPRSRVCGQARQFTQFADCFTCRASAREHFKTNHVAFVIWLTVIFEPGTIARDVKIRVVVFIKRTATTSPWFRRLRQIVMLPQPRNRDALLYLRTDFACRITR